MIDVTKVSVGTIIKFKKPHPCGGFDWMVLRIGVDWKLECVTCHRQIMISRIEAIKRIKEIKEPIN